MIETKKITEIEKEPEMQNIKELLSKGNNIDARRAAIKAVKESRKRHALLCKLHGDISQASGEKEEALQFYETAFEIIKPFSGEKETINAIEKAIAKLK